MVDAVDSFLRLPSPKTNLFLQLMLEWLQPACLFYAARRPTVLCTCAFAVDTLYNHVPRPKACTEGTVTSSTFSHSVELRIFCSTECKHSHVHVRCTLCSSNMDMRVCSFSCPIFERVFELLFVWLIPSYFKYDVC